MGERHRRKQISMQLSPDLKTFLVNEAARAKRSLQKEVEIRLEWTRREDMRLGLHGRKRT